MKPVAVAVLGRGLVDPDSPVLAADDVALARGQAAFETLRVYRGRAFALGEHLDRLVASAARMELPAVPTDPPATEKAGAPVVRHDVVRILRASLLALLCGGLGVSVIAAVFGDVKSFVGAAVISLITPPLLLALRNGYARFATTSAVALPQRRYTVVLPTPDRRAMSASSMPGRPRSASTSPTAWSTVARTRAVRPPGRAAEVATPRE